MWLDYDLITAFSNPCCVAYKLFMFYMYFIFSPKGAFGVPVAYERSFRYKLGQFRYLCQSAVLQGHVKINVTRATLFEDSFHQVSWHKGGGGCGEVKRRIIGKKITVCRHWCRIFNFGGTHDYS